MSRRPAPMGDDPNDRYRRVTCSAWGGGVGRNRCPSSRCCIGLSSTAVFNHHVYDDDDNNNNNNSMIMFMVLSSWQRHWHRDSLPGLLDEFNADSAPMAAIGLRVTGSLLPSTSTIAIYYYYSVRKLSLIVNSFNSKWTYYGSSSSSLLVY